MAARRCSLRSPTIPRPPRTNHAHHTFNHTTIHRNITERQYITRANPKQLNTARHFTNQRKRRRPNNTTKGQRPPIILPTHTREHYAKYNFSRRPKRFRRKQDNAHHSTPIHQQTPTMYPRHSQTCQEPNPSATDQDPTPYIQIYQFRRQLRFTRQPALIQARSPRRRYTSPITQRHTGMSLFSTQPRRLNQYLRRTTERANSPSHHQRTKTHRLQRHLTPKHNPKARYRANSNRNLPDHK